MGSIRTIRPLLPIVAEAAVLACQYYRHEERLAARFKADATIVTEADRRVEALLRQAIADQFPQANIIGEEIDSPYDAARPYTFIIDPIDGTAVFASGAPSWAICIGLLDQALRPIAGIVSAPCWGSLFVADIDPHRPALHNGEPMPLAEAFTWPGVNANTTLLVGSRLFQTHRLEGFPGKCRCFGSTALHICLVAQQRGFDVAHICPTHIWDIAAADAIAQRVGIRLQYLTGEPVTYAALLARQRTPDHLLAAPPAILDAMRPLFVAASG